MTSTRMVTLHPGRIIIEEFLEPNGISVCHLANDLGVPMRRLYEIVQGRCGITSDIAHCLAHYFGVSERYWLDLQARYDGRREVKTSKEFSGKQTLRHAR